MGQLRDVEAVNDQLSLEVKSMKRISQDQNSAIEEIDGEANYSGKI